MARKFNLVADYREDTGKGASRRLRHQGKVPAIIYGGGRPPRSLTFDHNKVMHELESESFYSSVLNIKVGAKSQPAIVKDIQRHPAKRQILHMDFQRIVEDQVIRMNVPIHLVGADIAVGVKQSGGTVSQMRTEVEVVCLPKDLPEHLDLDISKLELNGLMFLADIKLPEGVQIPELAQADEQVQPIVSIHMIKEEVIEEEVEVGLVAGVAVEGEEGEAPAEGAAPAAAPEEGESKED
ncbi:MAG: 50S ribosomal protein L25/general stress protein Ctc [Gammaproteobacteria bacterium]|nr:50S ribosomal protein L25/general stress protein Ctc [Gammaproteobacteria bacterium]